MLCRVCHASNLCSCMLWSPLRLMTWIISPLLVISLQSRICPNPLLPAICMGSVRAIPLWLFWQVYNYEIIFVFVYLYIMHIFSVSYTPHPCIRWSPRRSTDLCTLAHPCWPWNLHTRSNPWRKCVWHRTVNRSDINIVFCFVTSSIQYNMQISIIIGVSVTLYCYSCALCNLCYVLFAWYDMFYFFQET